MKRCSAMPFLIVALVVIALSSQAAQAHRRSYVWSQEYHTLAQGEVEFENFLTHKASDLDDHGKKNSWENQFELEYGVTDHFLVAVYQRFQYTDNDDHDGDFDYTGSKAEIKYRIAEKNVLPVDITLYAEYVRGEAPNDTDKMEYKVILSKDLGAFNVTYNQIYEDVVAEGDGIEHAYSAGVFYEFNPAWHVGLESTGNYTEDKYTVGPTVSWAAEKFWSALGLLGGLNEDTDDFQARLIIGIPF